MHEYTFGFVAISNGIPSLVKELALLAVKNGVRWSVAQNRESSLRFVITVIDFEEDFHELLKKDLWKIAQRAKCQLWEETLAGDFITRERLVEQKDGRIVSYQPEF